MLPLRLSEFWETEPPFFSVEVPPLLWLLLRMSELELFFRREEVLLGLRRLLLPFPLWSGLLAEFLLPLRKGDMLQHENGIEARPDKEFHLCLHRQLVRPI